MVREGVPKTDSGSTPVWSPPYNSTGSVLFWHGEWPLPSNQKSHLTTTQRHTQGPYVAEARQFFENPSDSRARRLWDFHDTESDLQDAFRANPFILRKPLVLRREESFALKPFNVTAVPFLPRKSLYEVQGE